MTTITLDRGRGTTTTIAERPQPGDASETEDESEVRSWTHSDDPWAWAISAMTGESQPELPDVPHTQPNESLESESPGGQFVVDYDEGATYDADGDLDWLSQNLDEVTSQYSNMWIAVVDKTVVASAGTLESLMEILSNADIDRPLITEIPPAEEVVWTVAYGSETL